MYQLKIIMAKLRITQKDEELLERMRAELKINADDHRSCLTHAGYSIEQYEMYRRNGNNSGTTDDLLSAIAHQLDDLRIEQRLINHNINTKHDTLVHKIDSRLDAQVNDLCVRCCCCGWLWVLCFHRP